MKHSAYRLLRHPVVAFAFAGLAYWHFGGREAAFVAGHSLILLGLFVLLFDAEIERGFESDLRAHGNETVFQLHRSLWELPRTAAALLVCVAGSSLICWRLFLDK